MTAWIKVSDNGRYRYFNLDNIEIPCDADDSANWREVRR